MVQVGTTEDATRIHGKRSWILALACSPYYGLWPTAKSTNLAVEHLALEFGISDVEQKELPPSGTAPF
jgi:hypothetical protein